MSEAPSDDQSEDQTREVARRHLRFGWWSLLVFLSLGIALETLHGFKAALYLDVSNETRRHLWTLAHAHGTLLSIVNVIFGATVAATADWRASSRELASRCLVGATFLMPGGFFLGGVFFYGGDPGLGIFLLPVGAALLFAAVFLAARSQDAP